MKINKIKYYIDVVETIILKKEDLNMREECHNGDF